MRNRSVYSICSFFTRALFETPYSQVRCTFCDNNNSVRRFYYTQHSILHDSFIVKRKRVLYNSWSTSSSSANSWEYLIYKKNSYMYTYSWIASITRELSEERALNNNKKKYNVVSIDVCLANVIVYIEHLRTLHVTLWLTIILSR